MGKIEFARRLKNLNHPEQLKKKFLFSAALILAGEMPGALVTFQKECYEGMGQMRELFRQETGVESVILYENQSTFSVFFYEPLALSEALKRPEAVRILKRYGYAAEQDLTCRLKHLQKRCGLGRRRAYFGRRFPHEIGIFLGYPPADVRAFIEKGGENYLCCRYWKVYHDEPAARKAFQRIDAIRIQAIQLIEKPGSLREKAVQISRLRIA